MPTIVTDREHERYKAKFALMGQPSNPGWSDWYDKLLQQPVLDSKRTSKVVEPRKIITTFSLRLRYNKKGRKRNKYNEWPMRLTCHAWYFRQLSKIGLAEILEETKVNTGKLEMPTKVKLYGDATEAYAIYEKEDVSNDAWGDATWLLREYEGSIH